MVLLIWHEFPETTKVYRFLDLGADVKEKILTAHNCYANGEEDPAKEAAAVWLSKFLEGKTPEFDSAKSTGPAKLVGFWGEIVVSGNSDASQKETGRD